MVQVYVMGRGLQELFVLGGFLRPWEWRGGGVGGGRDRISQTRQDPKEKNDGVRGGLRRLYRWLLTGVTWSVWLCMPVITKRPDIALPVT